jgi:glucokinase
MEQLIPMNSPSPSYILTADVGGSHITTGLFDLATGQMVTESTKRVEVDSKSAADHILGRWKTAFELALQTHHQSTIAGMSLAMPGPFDYENGISYIKGLDKYEALYGMDIRANLAGLLGIKQQDIRFRNDAESTIAGEVLAGAGKNYRRVMGITLGTGFGSAYSENSVTKDLNLGSDPFKESIADDYLSTRWFLKRYLDATGVRLTGSVKELATRAHHSEAAREVFKEFALHLSEFLAGPVKRLAPDVLVICGNIARASEFFLPLLSKTLGTVVIERAQLGENAPLIGAASLFAHSQLQPVNHSATKS